MSQKHIDNITDGREISLPARNRQVPFEGIVAAQAARIGGGKVG